MAYTINLTNGTTLVPGGLVDGTIDTTHSSLTLIGRDYAGYGAFLNENFVYLLENFANGTSPAHPLAGQLWWDTTNNVMKVYTGSSWKISTGAHSSPASSPPTNLSGQGGDLWFDTTNNQLKCYTGASWITIGPPATPATGNTGVFPVVMTDTSSGAHIVMQFTINGTVYAVFSKDSFASALAGFASIVPGLNFTSVGGFGLNTQSTSATASTLVLRDGSGAIAASGVSVGAGTVTAGTVTATTVNSSTFAGNVTGNVTGNITATSISTQSINATTGLTGQILTASQPSITTLAGLTSVTITGSATYNGNPIATVGGSASFSSINSTPIGNAAPASAAFTTVQVGTSVLPTANAVVDLGNTSLYWNNIYTANVRGVNVFATNAVMAVSNIAGANVVTGNIYSNRFFFANGNPFVSSLYSNSNVASYLTAGTTTVANLLYINGNVNSTSNTTGALRVLGGVGVDGTITANNLVTLSQSSFRVTSALTWPSYTPSVIVENTGSETAALTILGATFGNRVHLVNNSGNLIIVPPSGGNVAIAGGTASTSTTTGELVVAGGVGITGAINTGGTGSFNVGNTGDGLYVGASALRAIINAGAADGVSLRAETSTQAVYIYNNGQHTTGIKVGGTSGNVVVQPTTNSTSTTTGALVVAGGAGVAANVNIGGNLDVAGTRIRATNGLITGANITVTSGGVLVGNIDLGAGSDNLITARSANLRVRAATSSSIVEESGVVNISGIAATGTGTGAYRVAAGGGMSIDSGNLYIGGSAGNAIIHTGNVIPSANLTMNLGSPTAWYNTFYGKSMQATYADLAERFAADQPYPPGTVVELGGTAEITSVVEDSSEQVFGVISTSAAYLMNSGAGNNDTHPPVAVSGRVPVRVIGLVAKGDRLVSAGNGRARAGKHNELTPFNVIGRSLVDKQTEHEELIEAIVKINS